MKTLAGSPGVFELESNVSAGTLDVIYNSAVTGRTSIISVFNTNGFVLQPDSAAFSCAGSKIVIPANQIV